LVFNSNKLKKMKNSKSIFKLVAPMLIVAIAFALGGCKKMLDQKPLGRLSQEDLSGGFEGQVFGLYASLRNQFSDDANAWAFVLINDTRSEDMSAGSNNGDNAGAAPMYDNFQYAKDNWLMSNQWTKHYQMIGLANNIITAIDSAKLTDQASLEQRAEAKFFRAWSYFALVKEFGLVPKIDFRVFNDADANIAKVGDVGQIYTLIDADLADAAANLPVSWDATHIGRLTKGAAQALQARTFLFRSDFGNALNASTQVINSGQYGLFPDFFGQFEKANENNVESIFEMQAVYTQQSDADNGYNSGFAEVQGARGQGDWDLGWGENVPTPTLAAAFENGDPRRDASLVYLDSANAPYGEIIPRSSMVGDLSPTVFYFTKKGVYTDPADRAATGNKHGLWMNVRLIRYGEVLLTAAESANELGGADNDSLAVNLIEMLRARARNGDDAILPKINYVSQAQMRTAIRQERRIELATEHERFWDLVRWGTATTVLGPLGYADKNKYLPIPQGEIDKSNGTLIQNPDYP